ncbi:MAG: hypothetical protein JSS65_08335 [Armatimonadetes bacterium]|nr:hypothetical protein [Armatimonadota bacterium]
MAARLSTVVFMLFCAACTWAQGGPPLITDDPIPVEKGKWEINIAWLNRTVRLRQENQLPLLDINYGFSDRAHVKFEVPWMLAAEGGMVERGDGGGATGVKWRFVEGKGARPSVGVYPAVDFSLSRRSVDLGLAEGGTAFEAPLLVEWDFPRFSLNATAGPTFQAGRGPGWMAGLAAGRGHRGTQYLAEVFGEGVFESGESNWLAQVGLRRELSERATLLLAFGRTLWEHDSERQSWTSYLGIQLHD